MNRLPSLVAALAALASPACSEGGAQVTDDVAITDTDTATADADAPPPDTGEPAMVWTTDPDPVPPPALVTFTVRENGLGDRISTALTASLVFFAGPPGHDVAEDDGVCRLLVRANPFCDPPCGPEERCAPGDVCAPYPYTQTAGVITVDSDGGTVLEADDHTLGYYYASTNRPVAQTGSTVTAHAPGRAFPHFSLTGAMPPPLVIDGGAELHLTRGQPLVLSWTPDAPGTRVRVTLATDHGDHGLFLPYIVACDVPDEAGRVEVPASMASVIADPESWGCGRCPVQTIERYVRTRATFRGYDVGLELVREVDFFYKPSGA
ncbi:MAG: hypothetical protein KC635_13330 [Myxococcales bacterium]|nr:hypothetical protein [Myxococcales bacterium]MCB9736675.1 hypothetical protein [Deltaproteobacteria bacterium]